MSHKSTGAGANGVEKETASRLTTDITSVLEQLQTGTHFFKVRSPTKWYRRKYHLDDKHQYISYDPSFKFFGKEADRRVDLTDVQEVREGWRTDVFNKLERLSRVEGSKKERLSEGSCFSLIIGRDGHTLDLVAGNQKLRDIWVTGLQYLIRKIHNEEREQKYERWLMKQFNAADMNKSGALTFEETVQLLRNMNVDLSREQIRGLFEAANQNRSAGRRDSGKQVLDANEFQKLYRFITNHPAVEEIFDKFGVGSELGLQDAVRFFRDEQKENDMSPEQVEAILATCGTQKAIGWKDDSSFSQEDFCKLMFQDVFDAFSPAHRFVNQDMDQPLGDYFIASSHNTYLTSNQLAGSSSVEGYIYALDQGCRCVELDCWDSAEGEPIIYHGYTFTSKIFFRDVIQDAILHHAFKTSDYPVILSLEVHCGEEGQKKLAHHLTTILGDLLYTVPTKPDMKKLPPLNSLRKKVLVKAKKLPPSLHPGEAASQVPSGSEEEPDAPPPPAGAVIPEEEESAKKPSDGVPKKLSVPSEENQRKRAKASGHKVAKELSDLVNLVTAIKFVSFAEAERTGKPYHISSFGEDKAIRLATESRLEFVKYNARQMSRIYPAGKRQDSSNFEPCQFWNVGCQVVALNYQTEDKPNCLNRALFRMNGRCGYILKPRFLRDPAERSEKEQEKEKPDQKWTVTMRVIAGQHIPKPGGRMEGEIIDPYVKIKVYGEPRDKAKFTTKYISNNGFNPVWNETGTFVLEKPEMDIIYFAVKDSRSSGKNETLARCAIPAVALREGYRVVHLEDAYGAPMTPAALFVHVQITKQEFKPVVHFY